MGCEMGEEQQGFRRGTADGMFTVRQLVEKRLEGQENMDMLRWMGVPEVRRMGCSL